jgi:hypothetical protein
MVITGVADQIPTRINHLVYADAHVPFDNEGMLDTLPPTVRQFVEAGFQSSPDGWRHPGIGQPVTWPYEPHPWKCFTQGVTVTNPAAKLLPRTYIRHTADKGPGQLMDLVLATSFERAKAGGWRIYEIDASHDAPELDAKLLIELFP